MRVPIRSSVTRGALIIAFLYLWATNASGDEVAWIGTLTIDFVELAPVHVEGYGIANFESSGVELDTLHLDGGITGTGQAPIWSAPNPTYSISVGASVELGTGTLGPFWPPQPLSTNTLPVGGVAKLCVIVPGCGMVQGFPLSVNSGQTAVGVGGLLGGGGGPVRISVDAAPWTVGTATVSFPTPGGDVIEITTRGWSHGPASFAGSTAFTDGALSVVTPIQVTSGSAGQSLNSFGRLQVRFVPEPMRWVLLVAGAFGVVRLRARRAAKPLPRRCHDPHRDRTHPHKTR